MSELYSYLAQFVLALVTVAFKGFQYKNVQGNHYKLVGVTSFLMAAGDVVSIGFVVNNGLWSIVPAGLGAALGMLGSMFLHNRFIGKQHNNGESNG